MPTMQSCQLQASRRYADLCGRHEFDRIDGALQLLSRSCRYIRFAHVRGARVNMLYADDAILPVAIGRGASLCGRHVLDWVDGALQLLSRSCR